MTSLGVLVSFALLTGAVTGKGLWTNLVRRQGREAACQNLAEYIKDKLEQVNQHGEVDLFEGLEWVTSVNLRSTDEVAEIICNVAGPTAAPGIDYLDHSGILEHVVRRYYDIVVAAKNRFKPVLQMMLDSGHINDEERQLWELVLQGWNNLESMGFFDLDPEGVEEAGVYLERMMEYIEMPPATESNNEEPSPSGCSALKETANQLVNRLIAADPFVEQILQGVQMVTGLNVRDPEEFGNYVCDIAESESIRDIVDAIRDRNIFVNAAQFGFTMIRIHGSAELQRLEVYENMTDEELAEMLGTTHVEWYREYLEESLSLLRNLQQLEMID